MTSAKEESESGSIPILLLKTKSTPNDGYAEYFSQADGGFEPTFVPVLEHRFLEEGTRGVRTALREKAFTRSSNEVGYGGLIFTSQRAVEAFAKLVEEGNGQSGWPHLQDVPIYTVGPATSRALKSIPQSPPLNIFGSETGNGEALAHYILSHYGEWYKDEAAKPMLMFPVGEQRRDIIPKTLMDPDLPKETYICVEEITVYGTGVMESFPQDFTQVLQATVGREVRWVVVFSPTGCEAMLRALDMLDPSTGRIKTGERGGGCGNRKGCRRTYIATIGPTTRDYLRKTFGFEPDVCAEKPSPEGVGEGIKKFMDEVNRW